ncbi:alanine aminotransferase 2-like [Iris pallida]|uniref:Alanine aminotransferase 2-like n=1 Tax=Iris pallida TaxID=29817 RepID=A0AAX6I8J6_IRIPA|nr:alanine aminotransferase 2-like [Iris pallida]
MKEMLQTLCGSFLLLTNMANYRLFGLSGSFLLIEFLNINSGKFLTLCKKSFEYMQIEMTSFCVVPTFKV